MKIILKSDSGNELREYKFPDDWSLTVKAILDELVARAYR